MADHWRTLPSAAAARPYRREGGVASLIDDALNGLGGFFRLIKFWG